MMALMFALGIDIGGTSVKAAARRDGQVLWTGQSGFYLKPSADELRHAIRAAVNGRASELHAVGLCVPGILDPATRAITTAFNVPGLVGIPLDRLVPQALGLGVERPAAILNDAAATAHDLFLSRQIKDRLLVLTLGTGVGIAVLDNGKPLLVESDSPGHFGQIDVSIASCDVIGPDGGAGGLEAYLGAPALQKRHGPNLAAVLPDFTGQEPAMLALVHALRIAHAIYRPHHVVLCGGIGVRLRHLLPVLRSKIETHLTGLARPGWTFSTGDDDFHAARGAAALATA